MASQSNLAVQTKYLRVSGQMCEWPPFHEEKKWEVLNPKSNYNVTVIIVKTIQIWWISTSVISFETKFMD